MEGSAFVTRPALAIAALLCLALWAGGACGGEWFGMQGYARGLGVVRRRGAGDRRSNPKTLIWCSSMFY